MAFEGLRGRLRRAVATVAEDLQWGGGPFAEQRALIAGQAHAEASTAAWEPMASASVRYAFHATRPDPRPTGRLDAFGKSEDAQRLELYGRLGLESWRENAPLQMRHAADFEYLNPPATPALAPRGVPYDEAAQWLADLPGELAPGVTAREAWTVVRSTWPTKPMDKVSAEGLERIGRLFRAPDDGRGGPEGLGRAAAVEQRRDNAPSVAPGATETRPQRSAAAASTAPASRASAAQPTDSLASAAGGLGQAGRVHVRMGLKEARQRREQRRPRRLEHALPPRPIRDVTGRDWGAEPTQSRY